jgi:predicted metalloprotease with PDZ domain
MNRAPRPALAVRLLTCLTLFVASTAQARAQNAPLRAEYRVKLAEPAGERIDVDLVIDNVPNYAGPLMLAMRNGFALAKLPKPALIGKLRASDGAGNELRIMSPRPFAWVAVRPEDGTMRLEWSVPTDLRTRPEVVSIGDSYEWPFVGEDRGLLHTASLLPSPVGARTNARVRFEVPEGWEITSSWLLADDGAYIPPSHAALENDYIAVGNWATRRFEADELTVHLVAAPGREEWLEIAEEVTRTLVPAELELFGMAPAAQFLFVLDDPPQGAAPRDLAGSAKSSSLVISVPERLAGGELRDGLTRLVAHEFYHTWGQSRFGPGPELRWLQEGFCDYYAHLVSARLGLLAWSDFSNELASALGTWHQIGEASPLSMQGAGDLQAFVHEPNARALVYRGGLALAALCDRRIREARPGASLDDFMRALYNDPRWVLGRTSPTIVDVEAVLARFVGEESAAELLAMTSRSEAPELVELFRAAGADIATEAHPAKLRFDVKLDGAVVKHVVPGSEAQRFGLREGDELLTLNGASCESSRSIARLWSSPRDGKLHASIRRDGEALELEQAVPQELHFLVDPRPWKTHTATHWSKSSSED